MKAEIITGTDDNNIPYVELKIEPSDQLDAPFYITFRKYPRRVFVGVEDERENQSSGLDLEDCYLAPVVIIAKTPRAEFDPYKAFFMALAYLGEYKQIASTDGRDYDGDYCQDQYTGIETIVKEWSER
jgi:hypothetical protein